MVRSCQRENKAATALWIAPSPLGYEVKNSARIYRSGRIQSGVALATALQKVLLLVEDQRRILRSARAFTMAVNGQDLAIR